MTKSSGKSLAAWVPQLEVLPPVAAEHLRHWWQRARRVYPDATLKAWRCDWVIYWGYCEPRHLSALPAVGNQSERPRINISVHAIMGLIRKGRCQQR